MSRWQQGVQADGRRRLQGRASRRHLESGERGSCLLTPWASGRAPGTPVAASLLGCVLRKNQVGMESEDSLSKPNGPRVNTCPEGHTGLRSDQHRRGRLRKMRLKFGEGQKLGPESSAWLFFLELICNKESFTCSVAEASYLHGQA